MVITRDDKKKVIYTTFLKGRILWVLFIIHFFSACSAPFFSRRQLAPTRPDVLIKSIEDHAAKLRTFQGWSTMMIESTEGGFRGSMRLSVKMPDSLWIKMEGPLGMDVVEGRFGGENALFVIPAEKRAYRGSIRNMQERGILPLDLASPEMLQGILGLPVPYPAVYDSLPSLTIDSRKYILNMGYGERIWIEPKGPVVTRWEKRDANGEMLWLWEGREFRKRKGIRLPQVIRMTDYQYRQRVTLVYETARPNRPMKNGWFVVRIPEGVETIEL